MNERTLTWAKNRQLVKQRKVRNFLVKEGPPIFGALLIATAAFVNMQYQDSSKHLHKAPTAHKHEVQKTSNPIYDQIGKIFSEVMTTITDHPRKKEKIADKTIVDSPITPTTYQTVQFETYRM